LEEASISFQQLSNHPPSRVKHSIHVDLHWHWSGSLGRRQTLGDSLEVKLRVPLLHPGKSKVDTSNKIKFRFRRWIRSLVLKISNSWPKYLEKGFLRSITENIIVKAFRQPSTASPICWVQSCSSTRAPQRRALAQKVLVSNKTLLRDATHSLTRRSSATGSKKTPTQNRVKANTKKNWQEY
jgi:hypothetical protein